MIKIIYEELRKKVCEAKKEELSARPYFETVHNLLIAEKLSKKEGLLAIDPNPEYGEISKYLNEDDPLMEALALIVDGTEPECVIDIMLLHYFTRGYEGTEGVIALMNLVGALSIQAGETYATLLRKLEAMIPAPFYNEYKHLLYEAEAAENQTYEESMEEQINKLCNKPATFIDEGAENLAEIIFDKVIETALDEDLKEILQQVDTEDLALSLKNMSGASGRKVFDNIPRKLAYQIVEEMNSLGPVRLCDVDKAKSRILSIIIKKLCNGDFKLENYLLLSILMN